MNPPDPEELDYLVPCLQGITSLGPDERCPACGEPAQLHRNWRRDMTRRGKPLPPLPLRPPVSQLEEPTWNVGCTIELTVSTDVQATTELAAQMKLAEMIRVAEVRLQEAFPQGTATITKAEEK